MTTPRPRTPPPEVRRGFAKYVLVGELCLTFSAVLLPCRVLQGLFKRTVEVGRVVLLNYGPYAGKLAVIVEIIDHNRALISGPTTGVPRQQFAYKRLTLTDFVVARTPRGVRDGHLAKLITKEDVVAKFNKTAWAHKIERRKIRASLNDFDRFKLMKLKKKRSFVIGKAIPAAKKMLAK